MKNEDVLSKVREIASGIVMDPDVNVDEHVLQAGIDSLGMIHLLLSVQQEYSVELDLGQFIKVGTLRSLADTILAENTCP